MVCELLARNGIGRSAGPIPDDQITVTRPVFGFDRCVEPVRQLDGRSTR